MKPQGCICATHGDHAIWCPLSLEAVPPLGAWIKDALCEDLDMFEHPRDPVRRSLCEFCPVRTECATYGVESGQNHGIWGGLLPAELRRVRSGRLSLSEALA